MPTPKNQGLVIFTLEADAQVCLDLLNIELEYPQLDTVSCSYILKHPNRNEWAVPILVGWLDNLPEYLPNYVASETAKIDSWYNRSDPAIGI